MDVQIRRRLRNLVTILLLAFWNMGPACAQNSSLAEAVRLTEESFRYRAANQYQKAIPVAVRALAIAEATLGPKNYQIANALDNLAGLYKEIGSYAKAEPLYLRALVICEHEFGNAPRTANELNNLAALYSDMGNYEKAERLYKRSLAIKKEFLIPVHPSIATTLGNLADLYWKMGAYAKAEPLYQQALEIGEKALGPEDPSVGSTVNGLGILYFSMGAYSKAEQLLKRALDISEKSRGLDAPETASTINNLADLYSTIGAYAEAESLFKRSLAITERTFGSDHPQYADSLVNLSSLYQRTGAFSKAEPLLKQALAIFEKTGSAHPQTATALHNLAELYHATGAVTKAKPLYERALAMAAPNSPDIGAILEGLAALYRDAGDYPRAEPLQRRALGIAEQKFGIDHPTTGVALNNLGGLYFDNHAYAKAEMLFKRGLAIAEKESPEHPDTAAELNNLGYLYFATGALSRAEKLFEQAQQITEKNTARFLLTGAEPRKQAYVQRLLGIADSYVSFSLKARAEPGASALGLTAVLQYKGRVLDAMADSISLLRRSVDRDDQALFDRLSAVAQTLSTLAFKGPGKLSAQDYQKRLRDLADEQELFETRLSERSAAFRQAVTPVTLEGIRASLPPDAALVEYFRYTSFDPTMGGKGARWGASRYVAYVLRREAVPTAIDLGDAKEIDKMVDDYRASLTDRTQNSYKEAGQHLYAKIVEPLQSSLAGDTRLFISPDSELNLLPFSALVDDHGDYLMQRFEITYLTSGRDLLALASPVPALASPVVMADPDYGQSASGPPTNLALYRSSDLDRSGLVFAPLADTAEEAKALQRLFKLDAQDVLTGINATEEKLKRLHGPRILHVATHGFFLSDQQVAAGALRPVNFGVQAPPPPMGENPLLRSGLALAGANVRRSSEDNDGILTAAEAAQLDLRGTQLVVLSACETGLGEVQQGQGVYGLRRALVLAGAQAQLVSLWKVADAQTRALMTMYYERMLNGEGRSAALRETQKAMIADPATQHPYYWAAFLQIGDWTPLAAKK
ncbi:MAG: tetratricopeptide repeat protein [Bradyrhizobiaceae bacterium]|nr:MAG: tetratricopeptide repeat protein [Bradyrhizobiaceae bacterium]